MHRFMTSSMRPLQRLFLWFVGVVLVILFAAANSSSDFNLSSSWSTPESAAIQEGPVDAEIYQTARNLAFLAATPLEQQYAVEALRAADHELDQNFATAIRESNVARNVQDPVLAGTLQQEAKLKEAVRADKAAVEAVDANPSEVPDETEQRRRIAQAQLSLDEDELDNIEQELSRRGGNKQALVQQEFDHHRSSEAQASSLPKNTATAELESQHSLHSVVGKFRILSSLKERKQAINKARQKVIQTQRELEGERTMLLSVKPGIEVDERAPRAARIAALTVKANQQKRAGELEKRTRDLQQVVTVYSNWSLLVQSQTHLLRIALIADLISIVMSFLGIFALSGFAQWLIKRWETKHHSQLNHARVVITFILQIIVFTRVAIVIFGTPSNVSTIIGFITAGVTVALRDFIVSFIGWFVLMGKRGIQVGDWVEIDGTQGEVVEITVLHTFLLETGNWATNGQYTGRQAVLLNKYAVEKKYFNFTTHEQWMWEELIIPAPASRAIGPQLLVQVQAAVADLTHNQTVQAEAAWRDISKSHGLRFRENTPAVVVRTSAAGQEVVVRYVTKAPERFETAVKLRQSVLENLKLGCYAD